MNKKKSPAAANRPSQMTIFERWTLIFAAVGTIFAVGLQLFGMYTEHKKGAARRALDVTILEFDVTYDAKELKYRAVVNFTNNGNADVTVSNPHLRLALPFEHENIMPPGEPPQTKGHMNLDFDWNDKGEEIPFVLAPGCVIHSMPG